MSFRQVCAWLPMLGLLMFASAPAQEPDAGTDIGIESATDGSASAELPAESASEAVDELVPSGEYLRDLRTIEESVHHLKERAFRSKATLQLLKELVLEGGTLGSRVAIWHVNRMTGAYTMESVQYFLDGKNVYGKVDPNGSLDEFKELKVREQTVAPGTHSLQVQMVLRGNGFGIFSYLKTYQFKVQSSYSFEVEDGRLTTVRVIASSRGGLRRTFVERPNVKYEERSERLKVE